MFWIIILGPSLLEIELLCQVHGNNSFSLYSPNYLKNNLDYTKGYCHYINYVLYILPDIKLLNSLGKIHYLRKGWIQVLCMTY